MADDTEATAASTNPGTTGTATSPPKSAAMITQINADLDKKEREGVKAKMAAIVGEIRTAEKLIRVKTAELQKISDDYESGLA